MGMWYFLASSTLLFLPSVWLFLRKPGVLGHAILLFIALPCVLIVPLWIAGLDRLHKYYSELQARIAGNIVHLQESTEQKIIDLIKNPESRLAFGQRLDQEQKETLRFMGNFRKAFDSVETKHATDAQTPGAEKGPGTTGGNPGGSGEAPQAKP
jgi:hypothetical protein